MGEVPDYNFRSQIAVWPSFTYGRRATVLLLIVKIQNREKDTVFSVKRLGVIRAIR